MWLLMPSCLSNPCPSKVAVVAIDKGIKKVPPDPTSSSTMGESNLGKGGMKVIPSARIPLTEARGHSGSIWCLWNSNFQKVDAILQNSQLIHLKVEHKHSMPWLLTVIYGNPQRLIRKALWNNLKTLSNSINLPWSTIGNFNALLHDFKRRGGAGWNQHFAYMEFKSCIQEYDLIDLGYSSYPFTWKRGRLMKRLDKDLCKIDWYVTFLNACIKHLLPLKYDHPLCLQFSTPVVPNRRRRLFRFLASWLMHPDFKRLISSN
ncbi:hypothetical protein AHAS_Ahas13G0532500 [Arachis hypogaea]